MEELLHKAIENGDESRVRLLIQKGAAMDKLMGLRGTALCAAISDNQTSIALYLIDTGCDVNGEDYDKEPPLLLAMRKERFDIVRKLIHHPKCNLNKADPLTQLTPLCFAAKTGQTAVLDWLISAGCQLTGKDADGNTALHLAIAGSHYEIIRKLVEKECSLTKFNVEGFTPIHIMADKGDYNNLITILSQWISIDDKIPTTFAKLIMAETVQQKIHGILNTTTKFMNQTPLLLSALKGHSNLIKLLLICGADPNLADFSEQDIDGVQVRSYRYTPLMHLCMNYKKGVVKLDVITWLLDAGCVVNIPALESQRTMLTTPLAYASRYNLLELARLLVQYGADINLKTNHNTPLYEAILSNSEPVIWYFLQECEGVEYKGASGIAGGNYFHAAVSLTLDSKEKIVDELKLKGCSVNWTDNLHQTPLLMAIDKQNATCVRKILTLGADVMNRNKNLETPLHICADNGSLDIAKLLILYGASLDDKNSNEMTPLDVALEYFDDDDHKEIAILLLQNGCRVSASASAFIVEASNKSVDIEDFCDSDTDSCISSSTEESDEDLQTLLTKLMAERINNPVSLSVLEVTVIRSHFRQHSLSFAGINNLPLPKSIIARILLT